MVSRAFCIPGIVLLFAAFVLSFLTSISLPYLTALDITRTHYGNGLSAPDTSSNVPTIKELRFGIWAACVYEADNGHRICGPSKHAYTVTIFDPTNTKDSVEIASSWTRGLAIHPVATVVTFIAFVLSFSNHVTVTLLSSIVSFLAALLTLIAFAIDIALYAWVHHEMRKLPGSVNTNTGPGFWLTFVALILLLLAGCTVCFGRRRERMSGSSYGNSYQMTPKRRFWPFNRN
ncbi:pali-domain-containing protein [Neolentinus lepideus HHB14362 ss-1]|uniref:Pali-domain-containing protein n=1 Tax=Neolentinus lepideus HHB14362 ss-1 TaxID=1314782 RepID=A0A165SFR6_9AGAM|nr:pali-domain-containing protein [Neolentinus lepideus HHB14362 ss-1]